MKSVFNLRVWVLGVALIGAAVGSQALTLGRVRSVVLLGHPLELTVPVQFGADEDASAPCFDADVYYGDIQQERSRVRVSTLPSAQPQSAIVRVFAQGGVDEPVVTVYFRAGCDHKTTRRYVLLTEVASEVEAPVALATPAATRPNSVSAAPVAMPAPVPKAPARMMASPSKSAATDTSKQVPKVERPQRPPGLAEPRSSTQATSTKASKTREKARLKLAPLDMRVERDPILKSSDSLLDVPVDDLQKRVQAVAAWRALNASPEEILRQDARVQSMGGDIKSLAELTVKNQQALVYFASRLEQAEAQRYNNPVVYGLAFGLIACFAGIAYLLLRMGRGNLNAAPWWRGQSVASQPAANAPDARAPVKQAARTPLDLSLDDAATPARAHVFHDPLADHEGVDIDLEVRESEFARLVSGDGQATNTSKVAPSLAARPGVVGPRDFSHSVAATLRAINTQEMLDVRQQAEFFMTLGQHEEAIALLSHSIHSSNESNPLVYLDLLKVFHTLSRKGEYDQYRNAFNTLFSGRVPPYTHFAQEGHGLDEYGDVCQHIASLWPSEGALNFIEQCLVRSEEGPAHEFDLQGFRDLLTLHGVLSRLVSSTDSGFVPFSTSKSGAAAASFQPNDTMPTIASINADIGVDLDLSEPDSNLLEFDAIDLSLTPQITGKNR